MGLQFYLGASGAGKSYQVYGDIIEDAMKNPQRNYFIVVPDQFTMQTQLDIVKRHPNHGIMNIDVLSFGRLTHRIFEEVGGAKKQVLDDTGKSLVLRKVAANKEEELSVLKNHIKKIGYIHEVKSAISEFMQYGLTTENVEQLVEYAKKKGALSYKLKDLHILYESFLAYIKNQYITTEETLDLLREKLTKSRIVKDSVIVFDGFTGFTPVQYNVMEELLRQASKVIVTLTIDTRENPYQMDGEQKLFHLTKKTIHDLEKRAEQAGVSREKDVCIKEEKSYRLRNNEPLAHLERELFRYPSKAYDKPQDAIRIFEASTPKEEMRQVCLAIKQLIREKDYCYRDIAIVTGDMEGYSFLAKEQFELFEIPYFIDQTNKLVLNPLVEFIRSALLVVIQDYSYEAVFHFLRCGLSGISPQETDRLELYIKRTGIRGRKKWNTIFTRYTADEENKVEALQALNATRERIVDMLEPLMSKENTGEFYVKALYDFMLRADIAGKLQGYEDTFTAQGDLVKAKEYAQIYRLVLELLEQVVSLLGTERLTIKEFADILDAGFAEIKVGTIPQTVDKVVLGDIERTRLCDIKVLFFIGANDGTIPKSAGAGGIISDIDREFLQTSEFELAPTPRQQMYIQRLYLYMLLTKPSEKLVLSFARVDSEGKSLRPAYLIPTLQKLFPSLQEVEKPENRQALEQLSSFGDGLQYLIKLLRRYTSDELGEEKQLFFTLYDTYVRNEAYAPILEQMKRAAFFQYGTPRLPKELAKALYGQILKNSVSRLEQFASCAYAHFLKYGLQLAEQDSFTFESVDMGTVFHEVLQSFSEKLQEEGYSWFDFPKAVGERMVKECLEQYAATYGETVLYSSKRNEYMITRMNRILNRTVETLQYQLKQGSFTPASFEMSFQMTSDLDAVNISLSEEEKMKLVGRIDRIDTCKQEDKLYVKVIDYKSGTRKFDLAALYYGLQLQLVVYMNAAVEDQQKKNPDLEVYPAAMLYYHISDPMLETAGESLSEEQINQALHEELKMTGMVGKDAEIIDLLDHDFDSKSTVIPVAKNKSGEFSKTSSVLSQEDFTEISYFVNQKMKEIGSSILNGEIAWNPYTKTNGDACEYCSYKSVCGFDKKLGGHLYHELEDLSKEEAMERIRAEIDKKGEEKTWQ